MALPESTLYAVKQQCWDVQSASLNLLQYNGLVDTPADSGGNGGTQEASSAHPDAPQAPESEPNTKPTPWKHHLCDWKELWDHLLKRHKPLLDYTREIWRKIDKREKARAHQCHGHNLPPSDEIPGARESCNGWDAADQEYYDQCEGVAWMLRHLYEEQCDYYTAHRPRGTRTPPKMSSYGRDSVPPGQLPEHRSLDTPATPVAGVILPLQYNALEVLYARIGRMRSNGTVPSRKSLPG